MSMLIFSVGKNRYAIENAFILRIIPPIPLKKVTYVPTYVTGLLNFEGKTIPIVDFCQLIDKRAAQSAFHSRIIFISDFKPEPETRLIGILGEKVTNILPLQINEFSETSFHMPHFPYLNGVYEDAEGIIQRINIEELFSFLSKELFQKKEIKNDGI